MWYLQIFSCQTGAASYCYHIYYNIVSIQTEMTTHLAIFIIYIVDSQKGITIEQPN